MKLSDEITKIINQVDEDISIIVKDIEMEDYIYNYNSDMKVVSASLIKVPILIYVLSLIKQKKIEFNTKIFVSNEDILEDTEVFENGEKYYTIEELISWMIISSDNTATNVIIKYFGIENINQFIEKSLALNTTSLQRNMLDKEAIKNGFNNYTSQIDMMTIFLKLFNKEILNELLCDKAIRILENQRIKNQILRYIYKPVRFIHKTGSLEGLNSDCGIMIINSKAYYIGISVWNCKNSNDKQIVGKLGKIIYSYLENT